jgi:hypothetical protein
MLSATSGDEPNNNDSDKAEVEHVTYNFAVRFINLVLLPIGANIGDEQPSQREGISSHVADAAEKR